MEILRLKGLLALEGESRRVIVQAVRELFDEARTLFPSTNALFDCELAFPNPALL